METEIRWTPAASRDLDLAYEYLKRRNSAAARKLMRSLLEVLDRLEKFPEIGVVSAQLQPEGMYRQIVLKPYLVVYRIIDGVVWILRFWDSRRDPEFLRI